MKRLLPLVALIACGCSQAVDSRVSESTPTETTPVATDDLAAKVAANQGGQTASAFPTSTPPTDRASTTPSKYWVKLEMLDHEGGHEGHGESSEVESTAAPESH